MIFGAWALYVLWHIATRRTFLQETPTGFRALGPFRYHRVAWEELFAIGDRSVSDNILLIVYKRRGEQKERFLALSRRSAGDDNIETISRLIEVRRPGLPAFVGGKAVTS